MVTDQSNTTVAARISGELNKTLEAYASQSGSSKSDVIEEALKKFFDSQQRHPFSAGKAQEMGNTLPIYSLSENERRILILLAEIGSMSLSSKDDEDLTNYQYTDKEDFAKAREVLINGYVAEYDQVLPSIFPEMPVEMTNSAHDMMEMFQTLLWSYGQLSAEDRSRISEQNMLYLHCTGFDFNDSYELSIFEYLKYVRKDGRWVNVFDDMLEHSDNGNSHSPRLHVYQLMLEKYERIDQRHYGMGKPLSVEEIIDITTPYPPRDM